MQEIITGANFENIKNLQELSDLIVDLQSQIQGLENTISTKKERNESVVDDEKRIEVREQMIKAILSYAKLLNSAAILATAILANKEE